MHLTDRISKHYNCKNYTKTFNSHVTDKTEFIREFCWINKLSSQCYDKADEFKKEQAETLKNDLQQLGC